LFENWFHNRFLTSKKLDINLKIGLVRHFSVNYKFPRWCNSEIYNQEHSLYDQCDISVPSTSLPIEGYSICYTSTKKRAIETGRILFRDKEIIPTPDLDEVPLKALFNVKFKLPLFIWNLLGRLGWFLSLSDVPENKRQTMKRNTQFISKIVKSNQGNILLVSHGFLMFSLQKELRKMGFKGKFFCFPQNGKLYEYHSIEKK
jgi:hypothetical protein